MNIPVSDSELINAIKQAVSESQFALQHPKDWNLFLRDYLRTLGLRSYNDLHKNYSLCTVQLINNSYEITPSINNGKVGGFSDHPEKKLIVPVECNQKIFIEALE